MLKPSDVTIFLDNSERSTLLSCRRRGGSTTENDRDAPADPHVSRLVDLQGEASRVDAALSETAGNKPCRSWAPDDSAKWAEGLRKARLSE